jgi:hypothetical protein
MVDTFRMDEMYRDRKTGITFTVDFDDAGNMYITGLSNDRLTSARPVDCDLVSERGNAHADS